MSEFEADLSRVNVGQAAGAALTLIGEQLDDRERAVQRRMFMALENRESPLDPQMALQAFIELHEIFKLRQSLTKQQRIGARAGERVSGQMQIG